MLGALVQVGSVAGATWLVAADPGAAQPVTAGDVAMFATGSGFNDRSSADPGGSRKTNRMR